MTLISVHSFVSVASIVASPLHVETSSIKVTASLPSAERSTLSLHLVRTDDLLSDLDDHSILKRLTHIALKVELDEERQALSINGEKIDLKKLQKDDVANRVQAIKAEAFTLSDEIKEAFGQGEVMTQSEIVKSALQHLSKGIVSAEIRIAEEEVAPSMLPAGSSNKVADAQVSMKAFAVTITDVDSSSVMHSSSIMIPVLRIELEYDDGEELVVKMRHYAIQPNVRVVEADETTGVNVEIAENEDLDEIEQRRELVEQLDEDEDKDEDEDERPGEGKEGKPRRPDGGESRRPLSKSDTGRRPPLEDGYLRTPPEGGQRRPPPPGHRHHHHHHGPPPPPPAWVKWIAERLGVPPPHPSPPFHGRRPHRPHCEDVPPFHGRPGHDGEGRKELASGSRYGGRPERRPHYRPSNDEQTSPRRPEGHRHRHHHFGGRRPHHPPPFLHRMMHDMHAFLYVLGAALSTPPGRIVSFVLQGLMIVLIVVKLIRANRRYHQRRNVRLGEHEEVALPPAYSDRKEGEVAQALFVPSEELEIKISKA
ncbi:BQ2448_7337 [Microbotryum intermedium]|uniref:BQ2448_7337 protein n=1 Tax=Microbotryum intermedium TaxID=269621 RepID=A0A238FMN3_9BASI|nr:BQ2448_7337 [Microbotryum intermedium]